MSKEYDRTYYQALSEAATGDDTDGNIQTVLSSIAEGVAKAVRAKASSLALLTPDREFLRHVASYGLSEEYITKGRVSADTSIAETLKGKSVAILDAANDARVQYPAEAQQEGIVSILSVPIMLDDECMGVLRVYFAKERNFSEIDIEFVSTAARMGVKALENAIFGAEDREQRDYDAFRRQLLELEWGRWPAGSE